MNKKSPRSTGDGMVPVESKRLASGDLRAQLETIFQEPGGDLPDFRKLEHRSSSKLWMILGISFFMIVFLCVTAWIGYMFFLPFQTDDGEGLKISIDGPEHVVLGKETTYFVNWQNRSSRDLGAADIRINFPREFVLTSSNPPQTDPTQPWKLGSVSTHARGAIEIHGFFTGTKGAKSSIQAVGTYHPSNASSEFEAVAMRALTYEASVINASITVPKKVLPGDRVTIVYEIGNQGDQSLKNLEARLTLPDGFVREASTSTGSFDGNVVHFKISELKSNASTTYAVFGNFTAGHTGDATVVGDVGTVNDNGDFQSMQHSEGPLILLGGDLLIHLIADGETGDRTVGLRDTVRIVLSYENASTEPLNDVTLRLITEPASSSTSVGDRSSIFDLDHLTAVASGTRKGNVITWSPTDLEVLKKLTPTQDGALELSLPVISATPSTTPMTRIYAEATIGSVGDLPSKRTIRTSPMTFQLRSDVDASVGIRYFTEEGAPMGSGPLPPVSGQTTRYRVEWDVHKSLHAMKNIRLTASLPKRAAWTSRTNVSAGMVVYDDTTRLVTWTLNEMPADVDDANVTFDLDVTPGEVDVGNFVDVLNETRFEAYDTDVNDLIIRKKPALSSDLQDDEFAKSKGVVRAP